MYFVFLIVNIVLLILLKTKSGSADKLDANGKKTIKSAYRWLWSPFVLVVGALVLYSVSNFLFGGTGTTSQTPDGSSSGLVAGELETTSLSDSVGSMLNLVILVIGMLGATVIPIISWFKYRKASVLLRSKAAETPAEN